MKRQNLRVVLRIPAQKVFCTAFFENGKLLWLRICCCCCLQEVLWLRWVEVSGWAPALRTALLWEGQGMHMELDVLSSLMLSLKTFQRKRRKRRRKDRRKSVKHPKENAGNIPRTATATLSLSRTPVVRQEFSACSLASGNGIPEFSSHSLVPEMCLICSHID